MHYLNWDTLLTLKINGPASIYHMGIKIVEIIIYRTYKILSGNPSLFAGKLFIFGTWVTYHRHPR